VTAATTPRAFRCADAVALGYPVDQADAFRFAQQRVATRLRPDRKCSGGVARRDDDGAQPGMRAGVTRPLAELFIERLQQRAAIRRVNQIIDHSQRCLAQARMLQKQVFGAVHSALQPAPGRSEDVFRRHCRRGAVAERYQSGKVHGILCIVNLGGSGTGIFQISSIHKPPALPGEGCLPRASLRQCSQPCVFDILLSRVFSTGRVFRTCQRASPSAAYRAGSSTHHATDHDTDRSCHHGPDSSTRGRACHQTTTCQGGLRLPLGFFRAQGNLRRKVRILGRHAMAWNCLLDKVSLNRLGVCWMRSG
jgi:hypothetical protein